ncbi:MAG: TRAP transporter large permease [Eubacteriales bacterium]|jgi:tripartite ATP-independent transporter DctM subunit
MILVLFGTMFLFIVLGVPISFALGLSTVTAIVTFAPEMPLMLVVQRMFTGINSFPIMCIPFFILAGEFMSAGDISYKLINLANVFVGRIRGGLAHVNILASMFFGGVSGAATADASSLGAILIPTMEKAGYDKDFSVAVTATSAPIGIIIPPSNVMIVYATVAGSVSISGLFLAGIIPGILVGLGLMVVAYIICVKRGYNVDTSLAWKDVPRAILQGIPPMITFVIILGGILGGIFTPTESAVVAAFYSFCLSFFIYKNVQLKAIWGITRRAAIMTSVVLLLIGVSSIFGWLLAFAKIPVVLAETLLSITTNKNLLLLLIFLCLLVVGTFMDATPAVIIFAPIFLPLVQELGMDPIQFGLILVVSFAIGNYTPPVGAVLFITCGIGKISIDDAFKAIVPFMVSTIVVALLVIYVEPISMFLPRLLNG